MSIVLITRDSVDLWKHEYIRDYVNKRAGYRVDIICGENNLTKCVKPDVYYLYDDLQQFLHNYYNVPDEEIIREFKIQAPIIHANNYKHDLKYVYGYVKERELALTQIYAVYKTFHLYNLLKPKLVFMTGGATINRTVAFAVANYLKIKVYRMFPADFFNINRKGHRYFFCTNNFWRLSGDPDEKFDYPSNITDKFVSDFLSSIKNDHYQLDKYARAKGKALREGTRREPFEKKYSSNYALNSQLSITPEDIPKPFFLFPQSLSTDTQLLIRAPQFQDCLSICEQIANVLPFGHSLVIKEHPGHPGVIDHYRLKAVLKSYKNVYFICGDIRLQSLLPEAAALITVNSTSAIEALLHNIPVITLGESFYRGTGLTYDVSYLLELQSILTNAIAYKRNPSLTYQLLHSVISKLMQQTVPTPGLSATVENALDIASEAILFKVNKYI